MHHYKKGEYRDQFVIAYITNFENCEDIVLWAKRFCTILSKGLILLHISDKKYTEITTTQAQEKLKQINNNLEVAYFHSYVALKGNTKQVINNLGDLLNGVMIITKLDNDITDNNNPLNIKNLLSDFETSRLAYFVFKSWQENNNFGNVVFSVNADKRCKEKTLWASYFGRFANSLTHIFYRRYKDEYLQKQLNLNIGFLRRMFRNFDLSTLNVHSEDYTNKLDVVALSYAKQFNDSICIFQTTKTKSYVEFFTGLPEKKVLLAMDDIPVLFLNQRDDLFVMCE